MGSELIDFKEVFRLTNLSRPTTWRMERKGTFPARRQISANRVGWDRAEIQEFVNSRPKVVKAPFNQVATVVSKGAEPVKLT